VRAVHLLVVLALPLSSCGGAGLDEKANDSVDRLGHQQRAAAQVLVELEDASRHADTAALCRRVYTYEGTLQERERAFRDVLARERVMALEVQDVALRGDTATAHAKVTTVNNDGDRRTARYTFELLEAEAAWKVDIRD
jgi:hypothetical protein